MASVDRFLPFLFLRNATTRRKIPAGSATAAVAAAAVATVAAAAAVVMDKVVFLRGQFIPNYQIVGISCKDVIHRYRESLSFFYAGIRTL